MKNIARLATLVFGLSLPAYMTSQVVGAMHYAQGVVRSTNATTVATNVRFADCYSGGPAACGDAEEIREIQEGARALAAR